MKIILWILFSFQVFANGPSVEEGIFVFDQNKVYLSLFKEQKDLTIDHVSSEGYEIYGPSGLKIWAAKLEVNFIELEDQKNILESYPSPEQINKKLIELHNRYPEITQLFSIGKTVFGRDLLVMKISDNPSVDESEPEFKYISSMHGNEITGRELMVLLIEDLLQHYNSDAQITELINNTEIFIMPSMNPDGSDQQRRGNYRGIDLNRDFPDFTTSDNSNDQAGRQPETKAVMQFQSERNFALSANFHGGAEVVNYPWDTTDEHHPFEDMIHAMSLNYATLAPYIYNSTEFNQGVTNGYAWYEVDGGMQDWSGHWYNDLQVTIELSKTKWPSYSKIPYYWEQNRSSLINFIEDVHQGMGLKFQPGKWDEGTVEIWSLDKNKQWGRYGYTHGEFYMVLPEGHYRFDIYQKQQLKAQVEGNVKSGIQQENGNIIQLSL